MLKLDHIAVASTSLADGVAWVQEQLGATVQPGGRHARYGTHNQLLDLGDIYLEVIAPDPDAAPFEGPRWFDLDRFTGPPRLANWICQTDSFDQTIAITGPPVDLSRGDLRWRLTVPRDGSLPFDGAFPTLIQWAEGTVHPATRLPDSGCRLRRFEVSYPNVTLEGLVGIHDPRVAFINAPSGFRAVFDTPHGQRTLGGPTEKVT